MSFFSSRKSGAELLADAPRLDLSDPLAEGEHALDLPAHTADEPWKYDARWHPTTASVTLNLGRPADVDPDQWERQIRPFLSPRWLREVATYFAWLADRSGVDLPNVVTNARAPRPDPFLYSMGTWAWFDADGQQLPTPSGQPTGRYEYRVSPENLPLAAHIGPHAAAFARQNMARSAHADQAQQARQARADQAVADLTHLFPLTIRERQLLHLIGETYGLTPVEALPEEATRPW